MYFSNGCKIPMKKALLTGAQEAKAGITNDPSSCLDQIETQVLEPFEKCVSQNLTVGPIVNVGKLLNHVIRSGLGLPAEPYVNVNLPI